MNSYSTGIDIVELSRMERLSHKSSFLKRVFTDEELACCLKHAVPYRHLAGRFAAKEAVMKALGTGWSKGVEWKDIEVTVNKDNGVPVVKAHSEAGRFLGSRRIYLSISYSRELAVALAVIG